jgi:hypothetical protein
MKNNIQYYLLFLLVQIFFAIHGKAQLTTTPRGGNKKASISEQIGITDVMIHYSRPGVKNRSGHIWGELIPVGYTELGYGIKKPAPWRAGANENTTFEFTTDVRIEGQDLPAGKYGFFVAYDPAGSTLIFSKNSSSWGNFFYNPAEDALRVKVKPVKNEKSVEWLKYEFTDQTPTGTVIQLQWENLIIPFRIDVDLKTTQLESFRKELRGDKALPGSWQAWNQAAAYCAANNINLEEGLMWADSSLSPIFGGAGNFTAWQTKAAILDSMGRKEEAAEVMKNAMPMMDMIQGYTYGYSLIATDRKEAFVIFKMVYDKYPNTLFSNIGMASGYSAFGDYKKALPFAEKALLQAKGGNKAEIEKNIRDLQNGKDMNY